MRTRTVRLAWGIPPLIVMTLGGCTSDDSSDETASVDTLLEAIENDDNQVVDDVEIIHDPDTGDLSIGGIAIDGLDYFDGLEFSPDNTNRQVPLSWPILRLSLGTDPVDPFESYQTGVVVLEQTSLVTDADDRTRFFEQGFQVTMGEGRDVTASGMVEGTVDGSSRSCWWQGRRDILERLIMIFAGDGVASSLITISIPSDGPSAEQVAADLAEAACGVRPDAE